LCTNAYRLAEKHDVVVVTTNYRLGPLGWFFRALHAVMAGTGSWPMEGFADFAPGECAAFRFAELRPTTAP
jgi:carboxylesterase type B